MLWQATTLVHAIGLSKIPMIFYVGPRVMELDDDGCAVKIPLRWRTKNHMNTMYIGALVVGVDLAGGLNAATLIQKRHKKVQLIFKDLTCDFLKRPDGDVWFRNAQGRAVMEAVARADETGERVNLPMHITATVPAKHGEEPVASFTLGLSLKRK